MWTVMSATLFLALAGIVLIEAKPRPLFVKNYPVSATGCITCNGEPMPFVKVELMDADPFIDDTMATTRADGKGCFSASGYGRDFINGKPDPFIKVEYQYSGAHGRLDIEVMLGINRHGSTPPRSYASSINYGKINFSSIHCKAYVLFYKAMEDYAARAQQALPYGTLHVITGSILTAGSPYSTTDTIRIPHSYSQSQLTYEIAKHELAHTVRHSYDGDFAHFLADVVNYSYLQNHSCDKHTNNGFAFNEGWAEYWAGSCFGNYGSSPSDYSYEGNVAKALRALDAQCSSPAKFVKVLKANRGSIHSFEAFNNKHYALYNCKL